MSSVKELSTTERIIRCLHDIGLHVRSTNQKKHYEVGITDLDHEPNKEIRISRIREARKALKNTGFILISVVTRDLSPCIILQIKKIIPVNK